MRDADIASALLAHTAVMSVLLAGAAAVLARSGRFSWSSFGFWVWAVSALLFVVDPAVTALLGDPWPYYLRKLAHTDGSPRVYWVLAVVCVGLVSFFLSYLATSPMGRLARLTASRSAAADLAAVAFAAAAVAAAFWFRAGEAEHSQAAGSRLGEAGGWALAVHRLALFPITYLMMRRGTATVAAALLVAYLVTRQFDPRDRLTILTPIIATAMVYLDARGVRTLRLRYALPFAIVTFLPTVYLVARGHDSVRSVDLGPEEFANALVRSVSGPNTDMLSQMYVETYVYEREGYTFGVPFVESALFGYLPRSYFPWKDSLLDAYVFKPRGTDWEEVLIGPKSTVIGDLYTWGGMPVVAFGMAALGWLAGKADGLAMPYQSEAVRALGITVLSLSWMMFASSLAWALQYVFFAVIPFAVMCALAPGSPDGAGTEDAAWGSD